MSSYHLKMNDTKTEILIISKKRTTFVEAVPSIKVGNSTPVVSSSARNIGVLFDSELSLESHVKQVCRKCYWQLRNLGKLRKFLNRNALERLVHAFITSQIDYCNSLFVGLPSYLLNRLQRIQNTAARIITGVRSQEHITPVLMELHWLPVDQRVQFKILVLVYKCLHGLAPVYLRDLITCYQPPRTLRSANHLTLHVPFTRSALASDRAFSIAGPRLWNQLPCEIRNAESLVTFKRLLKTHLFRNIFNV